MFDDTCSYHRRDRDHTGDRTLKINTTRNNENDCKSVIENCLRIGHVDGAEEAIQRLFEIGSSNEACRQYDEQCKQMRSIYEMALECFEMNDFQAALDHIVDAQRLAIISLKFKLLKAECLIHLGCVNEANVIAFKCIKDEPSNAEAAYVAGLCSYLDGYLSGGLTYFQKALELNPNHKKARIMRFNARTLKVKKENGIELFEARRVHEACDIYTDAIKLLQTVPLDANIKAKLFYHRAQAHSKIKHFQNAIDDCNNALSNRPNYHEVFMLRAKCYNDIENYEQCVEDYLAAQSIKKTRETEIALREASIIKFKRRISRSEAEYKMRAAEKQDKIKNYAAALLLYSESIKLCPKTAIYYCKRSECLMMKGDYDRAIKDGHCAIACDNKLKDGYHCVIKCCIALGDIDEAEAAYNQLIEIDPDNDKSYGEQCKQQRFFVEEATRCLEKKDFKSAVDYIDKALKIAIACWNYKLLKAECLIHCERNDEANDIVELCIESDPLNVDAVYVAGLCSHYKGDLDEGLEYFEKLLEMDPKHKKALNMRATVKQINERRETIEKQFEAKKFHEAHKTVTEALEIDPLHKKFNEYLYLKRAECNKEMTNYINCVQDYEAALKINKNCDIKLPLDKAKNALKRHARNKMNAGIKKYKAKQYPTALKLFTEAIELIPKNIVYFCNRSNCLIMLRDYKSALKDSQVAIALDNMSKKGFKCNVKCYLALGDILKAEDAIEKFTKIDSNNKDIERFEKKYKQLQLSIKNAKECYKREEFHQCVEHLGSALKIATASMEFKLLKAECLIHLGRIEEANVIAFSSIKNDPSNVQAAYVAGLCSYHESYLSGGLTYFQKALELDPDHQNAQKMRHNARNLKEKVRNGDELLKTGKHNEACKIYTDALETDPLGANNIAKLLFNRASAYLKIGNIRNAIDDCTAALTMRPKYHDIRLLRAKCYNHMKNYKECARDLESVLKIKKSCEIEQALEEARKGQAQEKMIAGDDLFRKKNYSAALRLYIEAIELHPNNPIYYYNRSNCLMMMGDFEGALKDSQYAVELDNKYQKGYENISTCCTRLGDQIGAEWAITRINEIGDENYICKQYELATQCFWKREFREAVIRLDFGLKKVPSSIKLNLLKAECLIFLGRFDEANQIIVLCTKMDPSNADAIYVNGLCSYYYKGAMDVGLAYFQKALELYPDHGRARAMQIKAQNLKSKKDLGDNLFNAGRFSDAHQIYTEAIEIDPLNAIINLRLYFSRALTNSNIGNYQNAIQDCTCALKISPKSFEVLELRAKCYKAIENYEECVKDYVVAQEIQKTTENELALKDVWNTIRRNILLSQAENEKIAGDEQFKTRNYSEALQYYDQAIRLCPENNGYHSSRWRCLMKMGNYVGAYMEGCNAIDRDPKSKEGYECIIKCRLALGNLDGADRAVKDFIQIDPINGKHYAKQCDDLRSSLVLATQCMKQMDFEAAVKHADDVLAIATNQMTIKLLRAECLVYIGRINEAKCIADVCIKEDPKCVEASYVAGLSRCYNCDFDDGFTYFLNALKLNPNHNKSQNMHFKLISLKEKVKRADRYFNACRYRDACKIYTEALKIDPLNVYFNAKLYFSRAKCYNELFYFKECYHDYEAARKIEKSKMKFSLNG